MLTTKNGAELSFPFARPKKLRGQHPAANATKSGSIFGKNVTTILVDRDDSKASMADYKNDVKTIPAIQSM